MGDVAIGQTVELADGRLAVVRFYGQPHFAAGEWIGVELADDSGKNDGSVQGERYFECEMGRGMFVRPSAVVAMEPPAEVDTPKPAAAKSATGNGTAKKPVRPTVATGVSRRLSSVQDLGAGKRMSVNAGSPTPTTRSRPSSMLLRVSLIVVDTLARD